MSRSREFEKEEALLLLLSRLFERCAPPFAAPQPPRGEIDAACAFMQRHFAELITLDRLWEQMVEQERCAAIAQAMRALPDEDREIFYRFYDLSQTAAQIAEDLHLNASTVRSRLMRGRRTLREALEKGGLFCENDVG